MNLTMQEDDLRMIIIDPSADCELFAMGLLLDRRLAPRLKQAVDLTQISSKS